jgi:membrane fusion protein
VEESLFRQEVLEHRARKLHGEIVLGQSLSSRAIVSALTAIVLAVGLWLGLGSFARIEAARGFLVTETPSAKVVASTAGVVASLSVSEGSPVKKGDRLAIVILDRRAEDGSRFAGVSLEALRARMAIARSQVQLEGARLGGERERLRSGFAAAQNEARQLGEQIALQNEVVASNKQMFDQIGQVVERGFVSRHDFEQRRQTYLSSRQALGGLEQQRAAALSRADQARAELTVLQSQSAAQVDELLSGRLALEQQEAQIRGEQSYALVAPISGRVTALQTAQGRSVVPGATLMTIVPEGSKMRAEIYAPSRAIGLVRLGQETRLLFDAFPYQRFGSFGGHIAAVSRIAIDPRENQTAVEAKEPVYRVTVDLERQAVSAYGEAIALQPGMTLTANIILERQSFFGWVLTPLRAVLNRTQ